MSEARAGADMKSNLVPIRRPVAAEPAMSDEAVALACAAGDAAAVAELFDRFRQAVARYLSRLLVNPHDVEDCLQATFLEIARGRAQFAGRSSASTWLFGVATNVARHHARSAGRRSRLAGALRFAGDDEASGAPPDGVFDAKRRLERLRRALGALSEERREAFVLCELEGLSAREAAEALGAAETAIWKRVSDARRLLRDELARGQ